MQLDSLQFHNFNFRPTLDQLWYKKGTGVKKVFFNKFSFWPGLEPRPFFIPIKIGADF